MHKSATFTNRCAISSLLKARAPSNKGQKMTKTKTWCGPLDDTLLAIVGDKCSKLDLRYQDEDSSIP